VTKEYDLLVINIGSTSTKVALVRGRKVVVKNTIEYTRSELDQYADQSDQLPRRKEDLLLFVNQNDIDLRKIELIISRGGLGKPGPAGCYEINEAMCCDLMTAKYGKHASALGPAIAFDIAREYGIQAIVIDPPSTDELQPVARISGLPEIERRSGFHALNQKAAARKAATQIGRRYEKLNFVVAHMGGGITIGAHRRGRVIDCTHGLAEGPFTPERSGSLPTMALVDLAFSGLTKKELQSKLVGQGGLSAYLGISDAQKVESMIKEGHDNARLVYQAMAYQIAKDIGAMAVVLKGDVDGIVLTGGLACSKMLTEWIKGWINFLAPIFVYPGEDEIMSMAEGALRVLTGEEAVKKYQ